MSYHGVISHRGQSTSARNQRNTVSKLFETWRCHAREQNNDAAPAKSLEQLSPDELAKRAMYEAFAHWLTLVYRQQNDGKPLAPGTVMDYFGCLINLALHIATERAPGGRLPPSAARFFTCLDSGKGFMNMESAWLRGVKNNMRRRSVALHVDEGNSLDNSATPIFANHVRDCVAAYAKLGSKDAASRKLSILATWLACGRAGECQFLSYEGIRWDDTFECAFAETLQSKTSKIKIIPFAAGRTRHDDFYLSLADLLATRTASVYDPAYCDWILPDLRNAGSASSVLGSYIKQINTNSDAYSKEFASKGIGAALPAEAVGASIRPGGCTTLAIAMPDSWAISLTGHDMTGFSKLYEYVDFSLANSITAAQVLAGWPAPPYGQRSIGPRSPRLQLVVATGRTLESLDAIADEVFNIHSKSSPLLMASGSGQPGSLRELVRTAFASLLMYDEQREAAGEMHFVRMRLREAVAAVYPNEDAIQLIRSWCAIIASEFRTRNCHLINPVTANDTSAMQQMGRIINELGERVGELSKAVLAGNQLNLALQAQVAELQNNLIGLPAPAAAPPSPSGARGVVVAAADTGDENADDSRSDDDEALALVPVKPDTAIAHAAAQLDVNNALVRTAPHVANTPGDLEDKISADQFFGIAMRDHGGEVPPMAKKQDTHRMQLVIHLFKMMATDSELALLKNKRTDTGARLEILDQLSALVQVRVKKVLQGYGVKLPAQLKPPKRGVKRGPPPLSWYEHQLKSVKQALEDSTEKSKAAKLFRGDKASVRAWREKYESTGDAEVVAAPEETPAVCPARAMLRSMFARTR